MTSEVALVEQSSLIPNYERGFKKLFMGIVFVLLAFIPLFSHNGFWWWMLFPAAALLSKGTAELMRGRMGTGISVNALNSGTRPRAIVSPVASAKKLPKQDAERLMPPASVTEDETRKLNQTSNGKL